MALAIDEGGSCISGNDAPYTKLVIHSNNDDGSTTFVDSAAGSTTYTVTAVNSVHHETSVYKWGTSSIEFDPASADRLYVDAYDWNFGTGDFTMEMWARWKSDVASWMINYDSSHGWYYNGAGLIGFVDATVPAIALTGAFTPVVGTWYYLSVERHGDILIGCVNGVSTFSVDLAGKTINWADATSQILNIGRLSAGGVNADWYLDEIAINKGIAMYSGAALYEVPYGPYCD